MAKIKFGIDQDMQLSARSSKVKRQLHNIGLGIGIIMLITTLVLLGNAAYRAFLANKDFVGGTVSYKTMSSINQIVASILLMLVTSMTTLIFFRLYRAKSPFSRGNIVILRVVALILMLLSILPIAVQLLVASFYNINIGISVNFIYIFIGVIFYCISYMFEQGNIIQSSNTEAVGLREDLLLSYAEMAESKSSLTGQHVKRISEYTRILAKNYGLPDEEVEKLRLAAMFHNIGKLMIPIEILDKESTLSDEEFAIMKTHVVAGEQLLHNSSNPILQEAREMALEHHENWNGHGYLGKQSMAFYLLNENGDTISGYKRTNDIASEYNTLGIDESKFGAVGGKNNGNVQGNICTDNNKTACVVWLAISKLVFTVNKVEVNPTAVNILNHTL